jgi:hypothetical protein
MESLTVLTSIAASAEGTLAPLGPRPVASAAHFRLSLARIRDDVRGQVAVAAAGAAVQSAEGLGGGARGPVRVRGVDDLLLVPWRTRALRIEDFRSMLGFGL